MRIEKATNHTPLMGFWFEQTRQDWNRAPLIFVFPISDGLLASVLFCPLNCALKAPRSPLSPPTPMLQAIGDF